MTVSDGIVMAGIDNSRFLSVLAKDISLNLRQGLWGIPTMHQIAHKVKPPFFLMQIHHLGEHRLFQVKRSSGCHGQLLLRGSS